MLSPFFVELNKVKIIIPYHKAKSTNREKKTDIIKILCTFSIFFFSSIRTYKNLSFKIINYDYRVPNTTLIIVKHLTSIVPHV